MSTDGHHGGMPPELAEMLAEIRPADGFGHREHVHLAFLAVRRYGTVEAAQRIGGWLRHLTAYAGAPQKYNATVTWAWTEIVGHHLTGEAGDFDAFVARHPRLLDKRLLIQHYSPAVLASAPARSFWVEPDLVPFPWRQP
jgi:hypothetical protein